MRFRNAIRLVTDNFGNVYKMLLFRLVTGILFLSIAFVILSRGLHVIFESAEAQALVKIVADLFEVLGKGSPAFDDLVQFRDAFISTTGDFFIMLAANMGSIIGSLVGVIAVYLISRCLNGTATFAVGRILNDKMEAYSRTPFSTAYFQNIGKSMLYQILYVPVSFIYDVLALAACWFFFLYTPSFLPSFGFLTVFVGLAFSMTAFVCLEALKLTFISAWIPSIVTDGVGVCKGCSLSFKALKGFGGRFSNFLMAVYLIIVVNVMVALCTFGSMLLISIPASYLFLTCIQFICYYEDTGKKYFLSYRKISGADGKPETMGD